MYELIEREEYHTNHKWYEISGTGFFLDDKKETLFLFDSPDRDWDIELKNLTEKDCGETYKITELVDVKMMWEILKELEKNA